MAKVKVRSGSQIVEVIDTTDMANRLASVEARLNAMLPTRSGNWLVFDRGSNIVEAFGFATVNVNVVSEQYLDVPLPFTLAVVDLFDVTKVDNGWAISGNPYLYQFELSSARIIYWGNGATSIGASVLLQMHVVGVRA